ncbi:hypothetical protein ACNI3Q_05330 [Sphingomonas sp. FW199]|uniref:hypothetical protein n=1 Tax=Sphingomonas sp. FW199 TaxID=3400217 RepID=UPI003CF2F597
MTRAFFGPRLTIAAAMLLASTPLAAQLAPQTEAPPAPVIDTAARQAPVTDAGQIGQRQTRADIANGAGIQPMARINNRVSTRVETRFRNRLDRNYSEQSLLGWPPVR